MKKILLSKNYKIILLGGSNGLIDMDKFKFNLAKKWTHNWRFPI